MNLTVLSLMLVFSAGFFVLAAIMGEDRRGAYALLTGFVILLGAGLLVATTGIEYRSGASAVTSGSTTTVTYTYDSVSAAERAAVTLPLILVGLWGVLVTYGALKDSE